MQRDASHDGSGERGVALVLVLGVVIFALVMAFAAVEVAHSASLRVLQVENTERASSAVDSGLAYVVEHWRQTPTFLDNASTPWPATRSAQNALIGQVVTLSADVGTGAANPPLTYCRVLEIDRIGLGAGGATEGRIVTIMGVHGSSEYVVRALLAPNLNSPIQGVGTTSNQRWFGTSSFAASSADVGTIFGNNNAIIDAGAQITGNAKFNGSITNNGNVTGQVVTGVADQTFPDQTAVINAKTAAVAARQNVAGEWRSATTELLAAVSAAGAVAPTAMERFPASAGTLGSPWSNTNAMSMSHIAIEGGNLSLPAGNYAFGRLWLDGTTLTLKAPPGGGNLVMPDLYLTNGARLILDTTEGPFTVVSGANNAYDGSFTSASGRQKWSAGTNTFSNVTAGNPIAIKMGATLTANQDTGVWTGAGGVGGTAKPVKGNGTGYDDWQVQSDSFVASVTADPSSKGVEIFMKSGMDIVLLKNGNIFAGVPADIGTGATSGLDALKNPSYSATQLKGVDGGPLGSQGVQRNPLGFIAWSGGGDLPRLDVASGVDEGTGASYFSGLTYGGWEGRIGTTGSVYGAFVGTSLDNRGMITYDSRLAALVSSAEANSHHVVIRSRVNTWR